MWLDQRTFHRLSPRRICRTFQTCRNICEQDQFVVQLEVAWAKATIFLFSSLQVLCSLLGNTDETNCGESSLFSPSLTSNPRLVSTNTQWFREVPQMRDGSWLCGPLSWALRWGTCHWTSVLLHLLKSLGNHFALSYHYSLVWWRSIFSRVVWTGACGSWTWWSSTECSWRTSRAWPAAPGRVLLLVHDLTLRATGLVCCC